jgi:hypothetical protein
MTPQAARAEGPPRTRPRRMRKSREALLAARSHYSPKGGQSVAVFVNDCPPAGVLTSGDPHIGGEVGSAIACGGIDGGIDVPIDGGIDVPLRSLGLGRVRSCSR